MTEAGSPGWYTDDAGQQRYWTGTTWLTPAMNESGGGTPPPHRPRNRSRRRVLFLVVPCVAVILVIAAVVGLRQLERARTEAEQREQVRATQEASASASAARAAEEQERLEKEQEREEQRQRDQERIAERARLQAESERDRWDDFMTSGEAGSVWDVADPGEFYFQFMDSADFTCGHFNCIGVAVFTVSGCPSGAYVEASVLDDDGVVVDYTNLRIGALAPEETGAGLLETTTDWASTFRISKANCY